MQRVLGAEEAAVGQRGEEARADGLEHAGMDGDENLNLYGCMHSDFESEINDS